MLHYIFKHRRITETKAEEINKLYKTTEYKIKMNGAVYKTLLSLINITERKSM